MNEVKIFNMDEAAQYLGVKESDIRSYMRKHGMPHFWSHDQPWFYAVDVDNWLSEAASMLLRRASYPEEQGAAPIRQRISIG